MILDHRTFYVLCILVILLTGCTSLNFLASGRTPYKIQGPVKSEQVGARAVLKTVVQSGQNDFYFWGKSPGNVDINLEEMSNQLGLILPSQVVVEQSFSWKSVFYTVLTLGLYCPVDYKITVLSAKENWQ